MECYGGAVQWGSAMGQCNGAVQWGSAMGQCNGGQAMILSFTRGMRVGELMGGTD